MGRGQAKCHCESSSQSSCACFGEALATVTTTSAKPRSAESTWPTYRAFQTLQNYIENAGVDKDSAIAMRGC